MHMFTYFTGLRIGTYITCTYLCVCARVCVRVGVFLKQDFEITLCSTDLYQNEGLTQTRLL